MWHTSVRQFEAYVTKSRAFGIFFVYTKCTKRNNTQWVTHEFRTEFSMVLLIEHLSHWSECMPDPWSTINNFFIFLKIAQCLQSFMVRVRLRVCLARVSSSRTIHARQLMDATMQLCFDFLCWLCKNIFSSPYAPRKAVGLKTFFIFRFYFKFIFKILYNF